LENFKLKDGVVALFDSKGQLKTQRSILNEGILKMDTRAIPEGLYYYTLRNESGR